MSSIDDVESSDALFTKERYGMLLIYRIVLFPRYHVL